jgi:hypothetical protein
LLWATGQSEEAIRLFRLAAGILSHRRAILEAALARMRLAETLAERGEYGAFEMELCAAEAAFEAADATGYLSQCRSLRSSAGARTQT